MKDIQKYLSGHRSTVAKTVLFLLIVYCPFFLHLGDLPVRIWDEARLMFNTLQMAENGKWVVTHFDGRPDMWNTKPPLMIWCQLLFLKLIGNQELSFRLPSAIAGFLTSVLLMLVAIRLLKDYWLGLIAVLVLVTANGYVGYHVTRTGDYDALLTLFTTLYAFSFFRFSEKGEQRYLHLFFVGLLLAVLTKSVQGLLFLPALGIYVMINRSLKKLLQNKWLYIDLVVITLVVAGYYLLRESLNPGYVDAVLNNELGGRYLATTENHRHGFSFYLNLLMTDHFGYWFLFVPVGFFTGFFLSEGVLRRLVIFSGLVSVVYLLIISTAGTKLEWYDAPLYPFMAVLVAVVIRKIFTLLSDKQLSGKAVPKLLLPVLFLLFVFFIPYQGIISKVYKPRETNQEQEYYMISHFLQDAVKGDRSVKGHVLSYEGYNVHLRYYTDRLNQQQQQVMLKDTNDLAVGDLVICSQYFTREFIKKKFISEETGSYYNVTIYRIDGIRSKED
ncbi:MAG: glycosyltransferase family 39 protein [Bacteroidales bacterium]|mgnify:CR=1 FL=1|nr:glycosyltransferase family 39 protein [Bacteroidales bacterium]